DVAVPINLAAGRFGGGASIRAEALARAIIDDLANAGVSALVSVRPLQGTVVAADGGTTIAASGPGVGALTLTMEPTEAFTTAGPFDLSAAPVLHLDVVPRAVVRFDGDPSDIPDLTASQPADIRR